MAKKESKQISIRLFIMISLILVVVSGIVGALIGSKYGTIEGKLTNQGRKVKINYNDIKTYSIDEYSKLIKENFMNNLSTTRKKDIQIFYYDGVNEELKDSYFKMYIDEDRAFTYDSLTGNKEELIKFWDRVSKIITNDVATEYNNDHIIGVQEKDGTLYLTMYNSETRTIGEFGKLETDIKFDKIYNVNNMMENVPDKQGYIYVMDNVGNLYRIVNNDGNWTLNKNNIYKDGFKLKIYDFDSLKLGINFDGSISIDEDLLFDNNNLIRDINDNIIYANKIYLDNTSVDKNEYTMYIVDYRGMLYKRDINYTFTSNNNQFEFVGKLKGIHYEKDKNGIKKINALFDNDNSDTYTASSAFTEYNLFE